jgi:hypothetical protein
MDAEAEKFRKEVCPMCREYECCASLIQKGLEDYFPCVMHCLDTNPETNLDGLFIKEVR